MGGKKGGGKGGWGGGGAVKAHFLPGWIDKCPTSKEFGAVSPAEELSLVGVVWLVLCRKLASHLHTV